MRASTETLIAEYENLIALMMQEDGVAKFECKHEALIEWVDCAIPNKPNWGALNVNFRLKKKPVEGWAWKYSSGAMPALYNQKQPDNTTQIGRVMVLMREVIK